MGLFSPLLGEIMFDLWSTKDGEIVSIHDMVLDRVSDGTGDVHEHTYEQLRAFDFGIRKSEAFRGLKILLFEDILKKLACTCIMNVHVKSFDNVNPIPRETLEKIAGLIRRYDCVNHCYFMSGNETILNQMRQIAPDIARCAGAGDDPAEDLTDKALRTDSYKIQLFEPYFRLNPADYVEKAVKKAHENGVLVNLFYSDDPEETKRYLDLGVDTILTNDFQRNKLAFPEL